MSVERVQFFKAVPVDISSTNHQFANPVALYFGGTGNASVKLKDGTDPVSLVNVQGGTMLPIGVLTVYKVGTTATNMVALS